MAAGPGARGGSVPRLSGLKPGRGWEYYAFFAVGFELAACLEFVPGLVAYPFCFEGFIFMLF